MGGNPFSKRCYLLSFLLKMTLWTGCLLLSTSVTSQKSLCSVLHVGCSQYCKYWYWTPKLCNVLSLFLAQQTSQGAVHLSIKYLINTYYVSLYGNVKMHEAQPLPLKILVYLKFIVYLLHIRFYRLNCTLSKFIFWNPNLYYDYIWMQGL